MKKKLIGILFLLFIIVGFPVVAVAQSWVLSGLVMDQTNNAHLGFVKIEVNSNKSFIITDINGLFTIRSNEPIHHLLIRNRGYQPLLLDVTDKVSPLIIKLAPDQQTADSLSVNRADIYQYIDSVMHNEQYARIKRRQDALLSGEIPIGWFSLDMSRLKRFNQFEGVYLGLGGHTNEKLFQSVSLGGFAGYGFKDHKTKYGFDVSAWPDDEKHLTLNAGYSYDTQESGGGQFFDEKGEILEPSSFRTFYIRKMDYEQKMRFSVSFKQTNALFYGAIQRRIIDRGYDISDGVKVLLPENYNVSGIVAGVRWAPGQETLPVPGATESKRSLLPVLWLQLTRGIPGMFSGVYNYNRFEGKIQIAHTINHLGRSSLQVAGNLLEGRAPYFEYFNGRGSYGNFGIYASGSFVTMHPNEFMNDRSINFFYTHSFGNLFPKTVLFNPYPAIVFNYGWGKIQTIPSYYFLPVMDMHKGFVEAGIQLNNLLDLKIYGLGIGAYYRMGAYQNATVKENLVYKIVISFPGKD